LLRVQLLHVRLLGGSVLKTLLHPLHTTMRLLLLLGLLHALPCKPSKAAIGLAPHALANDLLPLEAHAGLLLL
jgi:hypothetical protein